MSLPQIRTAGYKQRIVRSHITFTCKFDAINDDFISPKAWWVVRGTLASCALGEHYFQSFSPAPNSATTQLLQAIACGAGKRHHSGDIKTAFLHNCLLPHEMIPIKLPPGMEIMGSRGRRVTRPRNLSAWAIWYAQCLIVLDS